MKEGYEDKKADGGRGTVGRRGWRWRLVRV